MRTTLATGRAGRTAEVQVFRIAPYIAASLLAAAKHQPPTPAPKPAPKPS